MLIRMYRPGLTGGPSFYHKALVSMDARVKPGHDVARTWHVALQRFPQRRLDSIRSQIIAATSGPPSAFTARMPVGEVTLISVR